MQAIRKRTPFVFEPKDESVVLDEQEQAEIVDRIKQQNVSSNRQNRIALQLMLGLSCTLFVLYILSNKTTPLFALFPPSDEVGERNAPLDMSGVLAYVAILVHVNLSLIVHPWNVVVAGRIIRAIGFLETLAWSAGGPLLSLYSGRAWQTTVWWCIPGILTGVVYAVHGWIQKADDEVAELDELRYTAPDASLALVLDEIANIRPLRRPKLVRFATDICLVAHGIRTAYLVDAVSPPNPTQVLVALLTALREKSPLFRSVAWWYHDPTTQSFLVNMPLLSEKVLARSDCVFVKLDSRLSASDERPDNLQTALCAMQSSMSGAPLFPLPDAFTQETLVPLAALLIDYPVAYVPASSTQTSFLQGEPLDVYTVSLSDQHVLLKFSCPRAVEIVSPETVVEKLKVKFTPRLERIGMHMLVTHHTETLERVAL